MNALLDPDGEGLETIPDPPALAAWRRKMWTGCLALMPLGLLGMLVGAAIAWGKRPMLGFVVGSLGMLLLVGGALCGKFAAAGPYPEATR